MSEIPKETIQLMLEATNAAARYRWLRCRNVPEFQELFLANMRDEGRFDDLVDIAMRAADSATSSESGRHDD